MLHVPSYSRRWDEKLAWYKAKGILPYDEKGKRKGTLIVTRDESNGSIDSVTPRIAIGVKSAIGS